MCLWAQELSNLLVSSKLDPPTLDMILHQVQHPYTLDMILNQARCNMHQTLYLIIWYFLPSGVLLKILSAKLLLISYNDLPCLAGLPNLPNRPEGHGIWVWTPGEVN